MDSKDEIVKESVNNIINTDNALNDSENKANNNSKELAKNQDQEESSDLTILGKLKKGQEIPVINYEIKTSETTPPSRYNSGSIILAMENAGKANRRRRIKRADKRSRNRNKCNQGRNNEKARKDRIYSNK